jgi:Regulator of chromosome condensation (RCC1) repeat
MQRFAQNHVLRNEQASLEDNFFFTLLRVLLFWCLISYYAVVFSSLETPVEIAALNGKQIEQVSCGPSHSAALSSTGQLYVWGQCTPRPGGYQPLSKPRCVSNAQWPRFTDLKCGTGNFTVVLLDGTGNK